MATKKIIEVDVVNSLSDNDAIFVNSDNSLKQISKSNLVTKGESGGYYAPAVDADGNLSWTASKPDMPAVDGANIKGPAGQKGEKGDKGDTGATGQKGDTGPKGDKGDPFTYSDFTEAQLATLKGPKGDTGEAGAPGKTPVRGTDYWTAADKQEIVNSVIAALPDGTEVSY